MDTSESGHDLDDMPTCPYCGFEERAWWEWLDEDQHHHEVVCEECDEVYHIRVYKSVQFTSEKT